MTDKKEALFQQGEFTLHSGKQTNFKIDCDALADDDWGALATMVSERFDFSVVHGIPRGGEKFAKALQEYMNPHSAFVLIVDDVLTTGRSMEEARGKYGVELCKGVVVFARGLCPNWICPLFQMLPDNPDGYDEKLYEQFPVKKKSHPAPATSPYVPTERLNEKEPKPDEGLLDEYELRLGQELSLNKTQKSHGRQILSDLIDIKDEEMAQECVKSEAIAFDMGKEEAQIECQQRVEGIFKELTSDGTKYHHIEGQEPEYYYEISLPVMEALKKKEGVE